jgi:hypothetical protein
MQLGIAFATAGAVASLAGGTQPVEARLHAVAPATGSGTFTASVTSTKNLVTLTWTITTSGVGAAVTAASVKTGGAHGITIPLCGPCKAPLHGRLALVPSMWSRVGGSAQVVLATHAHPAGALSGKLVVP